MEAWYQACPRIATESSGLAPLARKATALGALAKAPRLAKGLFRPWPWPMRKWAKSLWSTSPMGSSGSSAVTSAR
ncbi:MAG: hypothetical protein ACYCWA_04865 [Thiobacillus sp.]